ncbi:MAG: prepilin peptidase [Rhodomicrobium sp.]
MHLTDIADTATQQTIIKIIYAATLCYGCISDIRRLQIPNSVSLGIFGLFFLNNWLQTQPESLIPHAVAGGTAFLLTFGLYLAGAMGAGDVKLISALMFWGGVRDGPAFLIVMAVIGGLAAALLLTLQKTMAVWPSVHRFIPSRRLKAWASRGLFPYGIAICIAGLILMPAFFAPHR